MLELNDHINVALERYSLIKKGDISAARKVPRVVDASSPAPAPQPSAASGKKEVSLIDLDFDAGGGASQPAASNSAGGLEDDLLGLSFQDNSRAAFGQGGSISLGFGANNNISGPPLLSSTIQANNAATTQVRATPSPGPNYNVTISPTAPSTFSGMSSTSTPFSQVSSPPQNRPTPQFAPVPRPQQISQPTPQPTPQTQSQVSNDDDEWNFVAALPGSQAVTVPSEFILHSSTIQVTLSPRREPSGGIVAVAKFSNNTAQLIHDLTFSAAVQKVQS